MLVPPSPTPRITCPYVWLCLLRHFHERGSRGAPREEGSERIYFRVCTCGGCRGEGSRPWDLDLHWMLRGNGCNATNGCPCAGGGAEDARLPLWLVRKQRSAMSATTEEVWSLLWLRQRPWFVWVQTG